MAEKSSNVSLVISLVMRHCQVFVLIFICCFNEAHEDFVRDGKSVEKSEQSNKEGFNLEVGRKTSDQSNSLSQKKWKNSKSNNENNIFKSKIEILGEIFRKRVDYLKVDNKVK